MSTTKRHRRRFLMDQEKIGKFIAECRKEKGMTQNELAGKLGVTDKAVSKWENGRCMPDISLLRTLTEELGITINELLSGERITEDKYMERSDENMFELIRKVMEMENRTQKILLCLFAASMIISAVLFNFGSLWGEIGVVVTMVLGLFLIKSL